MIITSMLKMQEIQLFFSLQMIINNYQNIVSPSTVNTGGHAVDTLTGLLIDLIYDFVITSRI
jgi:hypothetical protein